MRITPLQINMVHLTGKQLPIEVQSKTLQARAKRILAAKDALVRATGQDLGYDVVKWHQYLSSSQVAEEIRGEYTWSDLHQRFEDWRPNSDWYLAVEEAKHLALEFPNCPHCGSFASLRKIFHGTPDAKEEMWLCNICKKRISLPSLNDRNMNNINGA